MQTISDKRESDIDERVKRIIHTQEIVRILRNSSRELPEEVREKGIKDYAVKLNKYRSTISATGLPIEFLLTKHSTDIF